jgi:hypothetical protein
MSYHNFSNLREIFQGDLNKQKTHGWKNLGTLWIDPATATVRQRLMGNVPIMESLVSGDFMDRPCNCNRASKIDGKCAYNELAEYVTSPTLDKHNKN